MAPKRLLILEDDDATRDSLSRFFHSRGYEVDGAATVGEAMIGLQKRPSFMILDLSLPDGAGELVLRRIRGHNASMCVTVCTGNEDPERLAAVRRLKPEAMFVKPIDLDDLVSAFEASSARNSRLDTPHRPLPAGRKPRRFERVPFFAKVDIHLGSRARPIASNSVDISVGGVRLMGPRALPIGEPVTLTFHVTTSEGSREEEVFGRVTNVRFDDDAALLGVEFAEVVTRASAPALARAIERI